MKATDVLMIAPQDLARKCRVPLVEAQSIVDIVCRALDRPPSLLEDLERSGTDAFTTGDSTLDGILGGGIRPGMIWELAGEGYAQLHPSLALFNEDFAFSASGKTQLALQLSLMVQLPPSKGGLSGSACYVTTYSVLPTTRLVEMLHENPLLSSSSCSLSNVKTVVAGSVGALQYILSNSVPALVQSSATSGDMPVRLLVIDSLAEVFPEDRPSAAQLSERSKSVSDISKMLHRLASQYRMAVVIINHVVDVWAQGADHGVQGDLIYADQARFFSRADSIPGEDRKSAALGLAWANQINARIMLTRTHRRQALDELHGRETKRPRLETPVPRSTVEVQPYLVRRFTIIFSSVSQPCSLNFIITAQGVSSIDDEISFSSPLSDPRISSASHTSGLDSSPPQPLMAGVSINDVAYAENDLQSTLDVAESHDVEGQEDDEEAHYWKELGGDDALSKNEGDVDE